VAKRIKLWRCTSCGHEYIARDERRSCPNCWSECRQDRVKLRHSNSRPIKGDVNAVIAVFDEQNSEAARIILADPAKYAGLPLEWDRHTWFKLRSPAGCGFRLSRRAAFGTYQKELAAYFEENEHC
jgi:hypothetical protein